MTPQALLDAIAHMPACTDAQRIFHGRGGAYPGCEQWTLDVYPPVCLLTSFLPVSEEALRPIQEALTQRWASLHPDQPLNLVFQYRNDARAETRLLCGAVPDPHVVSEAGALFRVHLMRGLNHGLFLDMAAGRQWVREHVAAHPGAKVLNLFAYTCAFSVAALQGGAAHVYNMDMAGGALSIGKQNHHLNDLNQHVGFWPHDVFTSWGKINRSGPYDLVIMDPPSYQKGSFVAEKDCARLVRRLPSLLAPGGHALLCLNSPKLGSDFLQHIVANEAEALEFVQRLPNPPAFVDVDAARALKVLIYRAPRTEPLPQTQIDTAGA